MLLLYIVTFIILDYANGDNTKGSLTFVIDDTWSMYDDIKQVKEKTDQIFDAVLNSNASKIEDFIIVTFNDPGAKLCTVTKDRDVFKKTLAEIKVDGGGNFPKYAIKGIELALEESKPNSFFYVFTEAAAKDYKEYERIKILALKKSIQVTFLITRECGNIPWENNAVYDKLAAATNGQVCHIEKQDVRKIIEYIIASTKHKKTTLAQKYFDNALKHNFRFAIDSKVWDVIISMSGVNPTYHITDTDGNKVETKEFIDTEKSHISKLDAKPGVYTVHFNSIGEVSAAITGSTSVGFQHGFSTDQPNSLNETSNKSIAGLPVYVSIALDNTDKDVSLDTIEIRDIDDNFISEFPLTLIDKNQQFYVTKPLLTPNSTFKLAVNGHTENKEKITRVALTTIKPQKPILEAPELKAPTVTILEGANITWEYDKSMTLKCKVNAFPKPHVLWQDNLETVYSFTTVPVDLPYEYMSILKIEKVKKNVTIHCRAVNLMGENSKHITIETKRNHFIKVIEFPKDTTLEYGAPAELYIKVEAFPQVKITWYINGKQIKNNNDYEVSSDGLRIRQMRQELKGNYTVEAYNEEERTKHHFKIDISGVIPVICKQINDYRAQKGSNVNISCRILKSKPPPVISWTFKQEGFETSVPLKEVTETLHLKNVGLKQIGTYTCLAHNEFGRDSHVVDLFVEYPPIIEKVETQVKIKEGDLVNLHCKVDGSPLPLVRWLFNEVEINNTEKYVYNNNSISFTGTIEDNGIYTCEAINCLGKAVKAFYVTIFIIPVIDKSISDYKAEKGSNVKISCRILKSIPSPVISWTFKQDGFETSVPLKEVTETLHLKNVGLKQIGIYTCLAHNEFGRDSHVVDLFVEYPPKIEKVETQVKIPEGDLVNLHCKVNGSPLPSVRWLFNEVEINNTGKYINNATSLSFTGSIEDDGIYTCEASNSLGGAEKHFYVTTFTPVSILANPLGATTYAAVKGDLALRIPCNAIGRPKPVVTWQTNGSNIASGTDWFDIEEDGTLIIKYPTLNSAGSYTCRASNDFSSDSKEFTVNVTPYPKLGYVTATLNLEIGTSHHVECDLPHRYGDIVNWFKDGQIITSGELYLTKLTTQDSGVYSCRVSTFISAQTLHKTVTVGYKPIFINEEDINIDFVEETFAYLDCSAYGVPKPQIIWKHNGNFVKTSDMNTSYIFEIKPDVIGIYECVVSNIFGNINRTFNIKNTKEAPELKAPTVTILEGANITWEYDKSMTLKCKVNAFPKPYVLWQDNLETVYSFTTVPVDLPYEYMSILKIEKVKKNVTIHCRAVNLMGENSKHITIETKRNHFIKVIEFPKDTTLEYGAPAELYIKVEAFPQVKITWYINGKQIKNNNDYEVSSDGLRIRQMRQELKGNYTVEAYNEEERTKHHFKIDISDVIPVIDKSVSDYKAEKGSNVNMSCRILKSKPPPVISWTFKQEGFETSVPLKEVTETLHLKNVGLKQIGMYTCLAHNEFGRDSHVVDLFVEYPPIIEKVETQVKIKEGDLVNLHCKVDGSPLPLVRWLFNEVEINNTGKYVYNNNSISFTGTIEDNGIYTCEAINSLGKAVKAFYVTIFIIPVIDKSISDYKAEKGSNVKISCRIIKSKPSPVISWTFKQEGFETSVPLKEVTETLHLKNVGLKQIGMYTCLAHNEFGRDSHVVDLFVEYPPIIEKVETQVKIKEGDLVNLHCKVDGSPLPLVRWLFNEVEINNTEKYVYNNNSISFTGTIEDNGIYTCEAINSLGKAVKAFYVTIFIIPVIDKSISDYKAEKGSNVKISCRIIKSKPSPVISWTFKQEGFETSVPLKEVTETLHLKNVGLKQIGMYTCLAHNEFGRDSHVVDLFVEYPPIIEKVETQVKIKEGDLVNLHCKVDGSPLPLVRWLFNEVEINNTGKYVYNNNSISFTGTIEDNGIYTCEAINSLGKAVKAFYVTIFIIPVIDKSISDYKAEKGSNVKISCRIIKSKPSPVISWTFKQEGFETSVPLKEVTETLHLKNVGLKQIGMYTCLAHNEFGRDSHVVDLFVEYPPIIEKVETQVKIKEGDLVNLHCKVDGSPLPLVRWLFNEVEINNTGKYVYNNNSISFTGTIEDNGIYTCEAINSLGKAVKAFYVTIFIIPVIDKSISDYKAEKGSNVKISCRIIKSKPSPVISWTFKQEGFETSVPLKEVTETLHLKNVGLKQIGMYTCLAHNEFGRDSHVVDLFVEYPPIIEKVETQVKIKEGDLVNLHCKVDGSPLPLVRWLFNEVEINNTGKYVYNNNSISFTGTIEDNGIYTCEAINSLGKAVKAFYVTIFIIPVIDKSISDYKAEKGSNVKISCRIIKSKPSPVISWTFKQEGFETSVPLKEVTETLHLKNVGLKQIGMYTCLAHNEFGRDSHVVDLFVEYPPIIEKVETQVKIKEGDLVNLHCKVDGSPLPLVRWLFNEVEINNTGKYVYNNNSISFTGTIEDNGIYTCEAINSLGKAVKAFYVTIFIIPVIDKSISDYKAEKGSNVKISCRIIKSKPSPVISWTFKQEGFETSVPLKEVTETLHLKNVGLKQIGMYTCLAHNEFGRDSHVVDLFVEYPPIIEKVETQVKIKEGDLVNLHCKVDGSPLPLVRWLFNEVEINNTGKYVYNNNSISFTGTIEDNGIYTCEAINSLGKAVKAFYVTIFIIPVIDKSISDYKAEKGSNVKISCRIIKSKPSPVISWTFKQEGFETSVPLKEVTETLHLKNVGLKQIGMYTCLAHNEFGRDSHVVDLFVEYPPIIEKVETQVKIKEGDLVNLHCKVDGSPLPLVRWLFNEVEINNTGKYVYNNNSISFTGTIEDNGIYTCEAINSLGKAVKAFYVTIFIIPVIDKSISDYKAEKGSNVKISCRIIKSKPSPVISWTFKQEGFETSVPLKEVTETLHLKNVGLKQIGMYTCLAHNEFGRDSHVVDLFVEYPPIIEKVETQVKIKEGDLVNLHCKVDGSPLPLVRWLFNEVEINNTGKYVYNNNSISFTGTIEDNGIYTCEAINSLGKAVKAFYVTIFIIPVIDKSISDYKAEKGSNVKISCRIIKSKPSPVISWTFKQEGFETSVPLKEVTETLHLKNVGLKQIGMYTCLAHNEFGRDSHVVDLFVEYPPIIEKVETQVKIKEGDLVNLHCKVDGSPLPLVRWLFNEVEINNTEKYVYNNNSISFTGTIEDNGIYTCEAINSLGKAVKAFYVTIFIIPVIDKSISDYKAEKGSNVKISCRIIKSKPSPVISWTFKQEGFETSVPLKEVTETLHLKNVGLKQIGMYTCLAHNEFGRDSHVVDLFVEYPPIIEKVETQVKIKEGDLVNLHCKVDGSPLPLVRWLFNEVEINNTEKYVYNNNSISFTGTIEDNGIYTCEAINSLGKAVKAFYVTIFIIPVIDKSISDYKAEKGSNVKISCRIIKSKPSPVISWTFKQEGFETSVPLKEVTETLHLKNVGLKQIGMYTCLAHNEFGRDSHVVDLFVEYPPIIEKVETQVKIKEGDLVNLHCKVNGSPLPSVRWLFNEVEINNTGKYINNATSLSFTGSIEDDGIYTCEASNSLGGAEKHFYVTTFTPVSILANPLGATTYAAVKGDLALRIPCNAIGRPKPVVTWQTNGSNIASGTDWFDIEEDGTLIIKYPTLNSAGSYTCRASNDFSSDSKEFTVNVTPYPKLGYVRATLNLEIGTSHHVECDLPHRYGDIVNWFKDGQIITSGELYLTKLTTQDSGVYSCRVSTFISAQTLHKTVTVGYKPIFINEEDINIDFVEETFAYLDCSAYGVPKPQIIWKHNGNFVKTSDMNTSYIFEIKPDVIGIYECVVSNIFGNINRTFNIKNTKEAPELKAPTVTILEGANITWEYDKSMTLKCKVNAFPKPYVLWQDNLETVYSFTTVPVDLPYEYMSILKIEKVKKNVTIHCRAVNLMGENSKHITIETKRNHFIKVIEFPKDTTLEYGAPAELYIKVEAFPQVKITWYINGKQIKNNNDYEVSSDGLRIRQMRQELKGNYTVEAYNEEERTKHHFKIDISDVIPVIDKSVSDYKAEKGSNVNMSCRILKSKPPPVISWTFKQEGFETSVPLKEVTETLHLKNVGLKQIGMYTCLAHNEFGRDSHVVDLFVEYPPIIEKVETQVKIKEGDLVNLHCKVDGSPLPLVRWLFNEVEINNTGKYVYNNNSISFTGTIEDNGIYTCEAINSLGKAVKTFYVTIFIIPVIDKSISDYKKAEKGSNVKISCRIIKSKPSPVISWTFKQEGFETSVPLKEVTETLHLKNVGLKQIGMYTCLAHNEFGRDSHVVDLFVEYPPIIEKVETQVKIKEGDLVNLHCKVDGSPLPLVRWLFNEVEINNTGKYVYNNNSISFTGTIEDNGIYTCEAINSLGKAVKTFYVTIFIIPVIDKSISDYKKAEKGSNVKISCRIIKSKPSPVISWTFKQEGFETSVPLKEVTETLHLKNVGLKQIGMYTCLAHNEFGRDSHVVDLFVEYPPIIEKVETQVKIKEGDLVNLHCKVDGSPLPLVRWLFNEVEINNTGKYVYNNNSISFTGTIEDNGIYTCEAINSLGKAVKTFYVTIFIIPVIDKSISDYKKAEKGSNVKISCRIIKSKPSPVISWTFKQEGFETSVPLKEVTETLHLKNVGLKQIGMYTCLAHNEFGRDSHVVDLFVEYPPIIEKVETQVKIKEGDLVNLHCKVDGSPLPLVRWLFNEVEINNTGKYVYNNNSISFTGTIEDNGIYTCEAINSLGKAVKTFYVTIFIIPVIDKSISDYKKAEKGSNVKISCRIIKSKPSPVISWTFKQEGFETSVPLKEVTETLHLKNVGLKQIGMYTCLAHNEFGRDSHVVDLFVEYPPIIEKVETQVKIKEGDLVNLHCKVDGSPLPLVRWLFNEVEINNTGKYVYNNNSISFTGTIEDNGIYTCEAINSLGKAVKTFYVTIFIIPVIDKSISDYKKAEKGSNVKISCRIIKSKPSPVISWTFKQEGFETSVPLKEVTETLHLKNVGLKQIGMYTCLAHNEFGRDSHVVDLFVEYPPIIEKVETQVKIKEGDLVNLHCKVDGSPLPLVRWLFNEVEINNTGKYVYNNNSISFTGTIEDNGIYTCEAINSLGKAVKTFYVTIFIIPVIDKSISDYKKAEKGSNVKISCRIIKSKPSPVISWTFKQEGFETSVPLKEVTETLHLKNVGLKQIGMYTCLAHNEFGRDSHVVDLFVEYPPIIEKVETQVKIKEGDLVNLHCKVDGSPLPLVRWLFNEVEINNTEKYVYNNNSISFTGTLEDNGIYTCEAINSLGKAVKTFYVTIFIIPVIDKSISDYKKAEKGSNVKISCRIIKSKPSPVISWTFKQEGFETSVPLKEVTETLHLKNVGLKQIGMYTCLAHNEFGRDSHVVDLFVEYPPIIEKVETQVKIKEGDLVNLHCKVDGSPLPLVRWLFNEVEINNTGKYVYNNNSISFTGTIEDNGIYTCEAINSLGKAVKTFYVTIFIIPVIDKSISDYKKAEKGSNVKISCRIIKSKPSPVISWTFKQEGFETSVPLKEVTETLHLKNVGLKQIGMYTCLAHNEFGRDSHVVDLFVEYPPIIEKVETQVKIKEGDLVNLHCKVDGSPLPLVRWLFNEVEINNTGKYVYNNNSISFTGTIEDNGIYTCEAINSLGKAVKTFYVTIFIIPVIDKSISDYKKAEKGSNVKISCRIIKSKPSPVISWTFKQEGFETSVPLKEVTETLHLKNVGLKQIGMYTCLAHNEFGRDSHVVDLFVEYPPIIEKVETQVKIKEGDLVNLHCKVDGSPLPLVRWLFNEVEINNTGKYVYNNNSISFTGTIEDNGIYTCEAINSLGKAVKTFYVTIFIIPVIDKSISDYKKAEKGSNVKISCRIIKSKPSPVISWTFKQEGFETSVPLKEVTETLHLKNVGLKQIGMYTCLAHNEFGRDSHVVDLFVEYPPIIEKVETQVKIKEGDLVNLHCKVDGSPLPLVRWLFNEVEINNTGKYVYNNNSISFTGTIEDNGIYTCEAINSLGKAVKTFYVTIFIIPVIDKSISDYKKAEKGSNVKISCRIIKSKPSPVISWTFKQEGFETSVPLKEVTETLHLKNVGLKQIGMYTCLAHNEFGRDSHVVDLFVEYPPIIEKVETQVKIKEGDLVNLHCKVDGSPLPLVRWLFNEVEINNTEKYVYNNNSISFTGTLEDNGIYTCEAINSLGKAVKTFYVTIFIIPVIDKGISDYKAEKGSNVKISCRIIKSKPSPVISWTFKQEGFETSVPLKEVTETLHLKNVGLKQKGKYTCLAHNEFGRDSHVVDLFVEYAPTIEKVKTQVKILKGQLVLLTCKVDGSPFPTVRWLFNKVEINNTGKYIFNANSLRFTGSIEDNGIYTCEAMNSLGEAKKHFYVTTFIPIKMKIPKQSNLKLNVGVSVELECLAEGYPKPKVQWIFYSKNSSIPSKCLRAESDGTLSLEHIQVEDEGFYRCSASNVGGFKSITYEIHVRAPVSILANPLGATTYDAVQGDLALRIPCNAIGNPKPVVTWETDGYKITSGTEWFDIEEDGTLIIKYPTLNSAGSYTCRVGNYFSADLKVFTVKVIPYPKLGYVTATLNLEIGTSHHVECDLPHRHGDIVNWFKDGKLITSGELYLTHLTIQDSGVYSCRVSTFISAQTLHKKVTVGCKPILINEEDINIDFVGGTFAYLNCSAYGEPKPQIIWKHNGNFVKTSDMNMSYKLKMTPDVIGSYECVVSNKFGNINRTFNIKNTKECLLNIDKDFNKHQPLLLSRSRQWPDLKKKYNFIRIPKSTHFLLSCPGNTVTYNEEEFGEYVKAICVDNLIFKIRDRNVDFSKLKCKEEIKSMAKSTNQSCFSGNTDLLRVGFSLKSNFLGVYDVCIDKDKKIPLFTRHNLHQGISGTLPKENFKFTGSKYLPFNFEDMYKCWYQLHLINLMTQNNLSSVNQCCFKKRQLVSPADVIPGLSQVATYNYLNVIPQWSTCGTENWDEIELRIQSLVNLFDIKLKVFTGSSYPLRLPGQVSDVFLSDRFKRLQPVPMYIWKVVQNIHDKSSLAIIQLNVPKITLSEALSYVRCKDICDEVEWMKNDYWHDVDKGFTFCCSITEFASYYGMLIKGHDKVFKTIPLVSDHSLIEHQYY